MKFKFLGTRGSYPTPKEENNHYGGNTPCIEVKNDQHRLILDAGTGILGIDFSAYEKLPRVDILLTHLHMDHIQGLGFFKPLFFREKEVHIWGPYSNADSLRARLNKYLSPPLFPLPIRDIPCKLSIHEIGNSCFQIGGFNITSAFVIHPGPTVGYRIEHDSKVLAYIPDHEPMIGVMELYKNDKWISGLQLSRSADVLIHDAQYTVKEYQKKVGWGHSSIKHAVDFAHRANVKRLFLFHHDPDHSDDFLNEILNDIKHHRAEKLKVEVARQGFEIEL